MLIYQIEFEDIMQLLKWIESKLRGKAVSKKIISSKDWLVESVQYFRELGFFDKYHSLPNSELVATLENLYREEWGEIFNPEDMLADLLLVKWDENRVWWEDTEADVCSGNGVYKRTLKEWAAISRGVFSPANIQEDWESEDGPVTITFTHDQQTVQLHPQFLDDYIDISILPQINKLIYSSGMEFAVYKVFDQTAFVVVLTAQEKGKLQNERGWRFANI